MFRNFATISRTSGSFTFMYNDDVYDYTPIPQVECRLCNGAASERRGPAAMKTMHDVTNCTPNFCSTCASIKRLLRLLPHLNSCSVWQLILCVESFAPTLLMGSFFASPRTYRGDFLGINPSALFIVEAQTEMLCRMVRTLVSIQTSCKYRADVFRSSKSINQLEIEPSNMRVAVRKA
jgi:hypothetical protein